MVTAIDLQTLIGDAVRGDLHEMFEFFPAAEGAVGVNAVLTYPDREEVQVWVLERDGEYLVTDHGEACGWLFRQGYAAELTAQQKSLVESVRRQLWLESDDGPLVARCPTLDAVPYAILRVALAAVRVADISYTCGGAG